MGVIFPQKTKLKKGDCIGILACAGSTNTSDLIEKLEHAKNYFESLGFLVKISDTAYSHDKDYLCDTDEARAKALNDFFADTSIDAIISARGGFGSIRILDKIDFDLIKNNPKIFAGYSDITALSLMIYKKTGLVTYNAPMAISDFGKNINEFTEKSFLKNFVENKNLKELPLYNPKIYYPGKTQGVLWGGNLATVQSLCGLDFIPDEKFIFITEDINEPTYKIDKIFTQLLNIKNFKQNLVGIVLGDFSGIDNSDYFENFFKDLAKHLSIPIISGLKFGHETEKETFPIGTDCLLDTENKIIKFL